MDSNAIMGDFNSPLLPINRLSRNRVNKEITDQINAMGQVNLVSPGHSIPQMQTDLVSVHGTF